MSHESGAEQDTLIVLTPTVPCSSLPGLYLNTTTSMNAGDANPMNIFTGLTGGVSISMTRRGRTPDTITASNTFRRAISTDWFNFP